MTYKTHLLNLKESTRKAIESVFVEYVDGKQCSVPCRRVELTMDNDLPAYTGRYTLPPDEKFVQYEECDMDWLTYFELAPGVKTVEYKKPRGVVLTIDGPQTLMEKSVVDADYGN